MNCSLLNSALTSWVNQKILESEEIMFLLQKIFQVEILALFVTEYTVKYCLPADKLI